MSDSTTIYRGIDFGPDADLVDLVRKRLSGQLDHLSDPNDPTRHLWLEQAYEHLRAQGTGAPLANAFASLVTDEHPAVLAGVFHFLGCYPDAPGASQAIERATRETLRSCAGHPDPIGYSPAGLEGLLLEALGRSEHAGAPWAQQEFRRAALAGDPAGPAFGPLALHDPGFLLREAGSIAAAGPYWLGTLIAVLGQRGLPQSVGWLAPRCDLVGRIARDGRTPLQSLEAAIDQVVYEAPVRDALRWVAANPTSIGDYSAEEVPSGEGADSVRSLATSSGGFWGGTIEALAPHDPGFVLRQLPAILRVTPAAAAPILAWLAATAGDLRMAARRIRSTGTLGSDAFAAIAAATLPPSERAAALTGWDSPRPPGTSP